MKNTISVAFLALLVLPPLAVGQNTVKPLPDTASSSHTASKASGDTANIAQRSGDPAQSSGAPDPSSGQLAQVKRATFGLGDKLSYYMTETYWNPSALTAPTFRAGLRMANPLGKGATRYPPEWRQGAEAFGRNFEDAVAERASFQTARFVTGVIVREDPRYVLSSSHNVLVRSLHALSFSFVDRSDSGHRMPALSTFVGAAAAGFVGNTYLPAGFNDVTHQANELRFGSDLPRAGICFANLRPRCLGQCVPSSC